MSSPTPRPDILLVTATKIETRVLKSAFQAQRTQITAPAGQMEAPITWLGVINDHVIGHVQCEMGAGGPGGAIVTLTGIYERCGPIPTVMLGIAAGLQEEKEQQKIGDIIVARQIWGYEHQRVNPRAGHSRAKTIWRGDRVSLSAKWRPIVASAIEHWEQEGLPKLFYGLLASGEKVADNKAFIRSLLRVESEALGLDMESYGLYVAAKEYKADWLVIKAISDFANGEKNHPDKDAHQKQAATNAVAFVLHLLTYFPPRELASPPVDLPSGNTPPAPPSEAWSPTSLPGGHDDRKTWADLIAAGEYPIAKGQKDEAIVRLGAFHIGRYAVTVGQYRQFIAAGGYGRPELWSANGWRWLAHQAISPPDLTDQADDLPLTGVSWYEALAFCAWLNADHAQGQGWKVGLPTEAEWEVAAKWSPVKGRMLAWDVPDHPPCQNVIEAGNGGPVAVTSFAEYASPCGAVGMAGNVWEWCSSSYEHYPVDASILLSDLSADTNDAPLRGGAYNIRHRRSGWDARTYDYPIVRREYRGFRICLRHTT